MAKSKKRDVFEEAAKKLCACRRGKRYLNKYNLRDWGGYGVFTAEGFLVFIPGVSPGLHFDESCLVPARE